MVKSLTERPETIFLDAVGTLFGVRDSVGAAYAQIAREFDVNVEATALDRAFFQSFRAAPRMAFPDAHPSTIPELEKQWWRAIAVQTFALVEAGDRFADFDGFFDRLYAYFAGAEPWFVYEDVFPALDTWQARGIALGIISNFDSRLQPVLAALGMDSFFRTVVISTEAGAAKPETRIFQHALERAGRPASNRVWHIGDSFSEDYEGAIGAGLHAIWLCRGDRDPQKTRLLSDIVF